MTKFNACVLMSEWISETYPRSLVWAFHDQPRGIVLEQLAIFLHGWDSVGSISPDGFFYPYCAVGWDLNMADPDFFRKFDSYLKQIKAFNWKFRFGLRVHKENL